MPISPKVFEGDAVEKLHSDNLHKVLHDTDKAGKAILGIEDENEIDTHSNRKGAATHAVSLCDGPDGTNVFMRAGWKFGSTQNAYLFQGGGGDSICGRAASGLPIDSKSTHEFTMSRTTPFTNTTLLLNALNKPAWVD